MRKLFVLILFATSLAFVQPSVAQVNFGFRGGLNISNMSLDEDVLNVSNRAGFFFGPTLKLGFGFLGADIAALYDLREAKVDGETIKHKSILVPVNARLNVGMDAFGLFLAAGPQFGFNVGDDEFKWNRENVENTFQLKKSTLSVNVGGGVHVGKLEVGATYNIAIGKTGEVKAEGAWETTKDAIRHFDAKNKGWQIYAAYYF